MRISDKASVQSKTFFRIASVLSVLTLPGRVVEAQTAADLLSALKTAAMQTSLEVNGLKPWHLKMDVTLTNQDGRQETGTLEEWHNNPAPSRTEYDLPSYHGSVVRKGDLLYRSPGLEQPPFELSYLESAVLRPLPPPDALDGRAATLVEPGFREDVFRCAALAPKDVSVQPRYYYVWPTYCFDPRSLSFQATVQYSLVTLRVQVSSFLGVRVPVQLTITANGRPYASGHITELQSSAEPYTSAQAIDGLMQQPSDPLDVTSRAQDGPVKKVSPTYPAGAKQAHIMGTVWLHTVIGIDGHVRVLGVITSPSDDLSAAASQAVQQWIYKPYSRNGVTFEVYTDIAVNFMLG